MTVLINRVDESQLGGRNEEELNLTGSCLQWSPREMSVKASRGDAARGECDEIELTPESCDDNSPSFVPVLTLFVDEDTLKLDDSESGMSVVQFCSKREENSLALRASFARTAEKLTNCVVVRELGPRLT
jgi:hypothetical protein